MAKDDAPRLPEGMVRRLRAWRERHRLPATHPRLETSIQSVDNPPPLLPHASARSIDGGTSRPANVSRGAGPRFTTSLQSIANPPPLLPGAGDRSIEEQLRRPRLQSAAGQFESTTAASQPQAQLQTPSHPSSPSTRIASTQRDVHGSTPTRSSRRNTAQQASPHKDKNTVILVCSLPNTLDTSPTYHQSTPSRLTMTSWHRDPLLNEPSEEVDEMHRNTDKEALRNLVHHDEAKERPSSSFGLNTLPAEYHFYRPAADGKVHYNRKPIVTRVPGSPLPWSPFIAALLTEVSCHHNKDEKASFGRMYFTETHKVHDTAREHAGPDLVYVPMRNTEEEAANFLDIRPEHRVKFLEIALETEIDDDQPVLPIYLTQAPEIQPTGIHMSTSTTIDSKKKECLIECFDGRLYLISIQDMAKKMKVVTDSYRKPGCSKYRLMASRSHPAEGTRGFREANGNISVLKNYRIDGADPFYELMKAIDNFWEEHAQEHAITFREARTASWGVV